MIDDNDRPSTSPSGGGPTYINVNDLRPEGDDDTCLRPLGLCDLGGCCESCWYRPDHPRFQRATRGGAG